MGACVCVCGVCVCGVCLCVCLCGVCVCDVCVYACVHMYVYLKSNRLCVVINTAK